MPDDDPAPQLRADAWCGTEAASGGLSPHATAWALQGAIAREAPLAAAAPGVDPADWKDPRVGWGIVLADRDGLSDATKAAASDAPEPIRRLLQARGNAPVFRYNAAIRDGRLRRYYPDKHPADLRLQGKRGVETDVSVPRYLLIVGSPRDIPWSFQYRLQTDAFVGRLDLDDAGLARYVDALLDEFVQVPREVDRPVLWAVDHGHPDITRLMRRRIADPLAAAFAGSGFDPRLLSDADASHARLRGTLAERRPAFVLTSSHGATFPLDDPPALQAQLGLPVDCNHELLDLAALLHEWDPGGALWYAHACCSAGADKPSKFQGLVDPGSTLGRTLAGIAGAGPCSAPAPRALLGAEHPLAAFIGHVEPTFDWTLRDPDTNQVMTDSLIIDTLFTALHGQDRPPVGLALDGYYDAVAGLLLDHVDAVAAFNGHEAGADARARKAKLLAMDRLAMVILGDPTVRLPA